MYQEGSGFMKKYRYILNGCPLDTDKIYGYKLVASNNIKTSYNGQSILKVLIPPDLKLARYSCDSYSTLEDERTIEDLGYDIFR